MASFAAGASGTASSSSSPGWPCCFRWSGVERAVGSAYSNTFTLPGTESTRALDLLSSALPKQAGDSDTIVWHVQSGTVNDPAVETRLQTLLQKVAAAPYRGRRAQPLHPHRRRPDQQGRQDRLRHRRLHQAGPGPAQARRPPCHRPRGARAHARPPGRDRRPGHRGGPADAAVQQRGLRPHRRRHHHPDRLRFAARHGAAPGGGRRRAGDRGVRQATSSRTS